jgi:hypothetical protein
MHFIKKTELMQVDQLLELGVNVTIYNGQVLTVRSPETIHTMSACFFITPRPASIQRVDEWICSTTHLLICLNEQILPSLPGL